MRPDRIVIAIAAAAMLLAGRPAAAQAPQAAHPQSLEELAARLRQLQTDLATLTGNAGTFNRCTMRSGVLPFRVIRISSPDVSSVT